MKTIGKIGVHDGLYLLRVPFSPVLRAETALACKTDFATWHKRMRHPSSPRQLSMKSLLLFYNNSSGHDHCRVCPLAKQKRLSFTSNNHVAETIFDLVHCDIWGPFNTKTHDGFSYFLTIVYDCSRFTWVYLLRHKNDVHLIITRFFKLVETHFLKTIKVFRSDNAPELKFEEFFTSTGTIHQFSCVQTPQQNSVVERKHQHLFNVARAIMFQSHISLYFWGECVLMAAHLLNRTVMPLLSHRIPFSVLYGKEADYSLIRTFGCLAYASTLAAKRTKFDLRATPCVFMGYSAGVKGYKLYDIKKKSFFL